jgi:hypothetical protein
MSTIHESGPAFPIVARNEVYDLGMSLRDWFAGQAMAAILKDYGVDRHDLCAEAAYDMADAMLAERSKP